MWRVHFLLAVGLILAGTGNATAAANPDGPCVRLESRIADLRLKLRLGYSARQGRVYRQKLAALESERRQLCRS
jgi:hypothetical protein